VSLKETIIKKVALHWGKHVHTKWWFGYVGRCRVVEHHDHVTGMVHGDGFFGLGNQHLSKLSVPLKKAWIFFETCGVSGSHTSFW